MSARPVSSPDSARFVIDGDRLSTAVGNGSLGGLGDELWRALGELSYLPQAFLP